jgi:hypothetical protein
MSAIPRRAKSRLRWCTASGASDRLDRATLDRLVRSIRRLFDVDADEPAADVTGPDRRIEIERSFELGIVHWVPELWA